MPIRIRGDEDKGLSEEDIASIIARLLAAVQWESLNWAAAQTFEEIRVGDGGITFYDGAGTIAGTVRGTSALAQPTEALRAAMANFPGIHNPTYTLVVA